jgi:plastocyanin
MIVAPDLGAAGREGAAASSGCAWKRHTKHIVKHVRRHGKSRRVVRTRHWWSCVHVPAPESGGGAPSVPGSGPPPADEESAAGRLGVKASEYKFVLSRPSVTTGEVVVELDNQGEDPHNLNLQLADGQGPEFHLGQVDSQKRAVARFNLPAGTYRLWCSFPNHEELGMKATLSVGP